MTSRSRLSIAKFYDSIFYASKCNPIQRYAGLDKSNLCTVMMLHLSSYSKLKIPSTQHHMSQSP
jgi:hypothetical protein